MNVLLPPVLRSIAFVVHDGCNTISVAGPANVAEYIEDLATVD